MTSTHRLTRPNQTKPFIGRTMELNIFEEWLHHPEAPLRIFHLSGMGGIGKSTLMNEMISIAKQHRTIPIWLDGRSCMQTPVGFLDYIGSTLRLELWNQEPSHPLEPLFSAHNEQRFLLCIDNYEHLSLLEGWLIHVFFPKLPSVGVAIVLASRGGLSSIWKTDRIWASHLVELELAHFTTEETCDYIISRVGAIHEEWIRELTRASNGHPLALALAVEEMIKHNALSPSDKMIVSQSISAHLLRELTTSELEPLIDALLVLLHANQELLSLFLEQEVSKEQYRTLQDMSFIKNGPEGLALHDLARMHLIQDFKLREPQRLQTLRGRAVSILHQAFTKAERSKRRELAARILILCKDALQFDRMYADLTFEPLLSSAEAMDTADLPVLHRILEQWCEYSIDAWQSRLYHQFLDDLAIHSPESIVVIRDSTGQAIAMFINVLLYDQTSLLLKKYFADELAECCSTEELSCNPDQADTYYAVLGAAVKDYSMLSREELVGLLTLDRLSLLGDGARAVLVATNPDLKRLLQQLGFKLRPTRTRKCDTSYARADVLELDLRNDGFGEWITSFFPEIMKQQAVNAVVPHPLSISEVRKLFTSLYRPAELIRFLPFFSAMKEPSELQKYLLSLLQHDALGLSEQDRLILKCTYCVHPGNAVAAATDCNMSRATYYRHLQKALSNVTVLLQGLAVP